MARALFFIFKAPRGNAVIISDRDGPVSVTNDAEAVVSYVLSRYSRDVRIIYRDTDGRWDELKHNGEFFTGFKQLTEADLEDFKVIHS